MKDRVMGAWMLTLAALVAAPASAGPVKPVEPSVGADLSANAGHKINDLRDVRGQVRSQSDSLPAFVTASSAVAAEQIEAKSQDRLDVLVVTGARSDGHPMLQSKDLPAARELADRLREIPGLSGSRMGGHGTDPAIRGLSQNRINVLLDGAFVQGACPNRMDPPTAYAAALGYDRTTVVKGMRSLEYSGGPGGSILMERVRPTFGNDRGWLGTVSAGLRSNGNGRELGADLSVGDERRYLRLLGAVTDAGNYDDGGGNEVRSAYEERTLALVAGADVGAESTLELSLERQQLRDVLFAGAGMDSPKSDNRALRLKFEQASLGWFTDIRAELHHADVRHVMDNFSLRTTPMADLRVPSSSETSGLRLTGQIERDRQTWRMGLDWNRNDREAVRQNVMTGQPQSLLWPDVRISGLGAFVELEHGLRDDLRVIAGLRFDRVSSRARAADRQPAGTMRRPNALYARYYDGALAGSETENQWGGLARLERELTALPGMIYLGLSQTFRSADATERFLASDNMNPSARWVGHPDIDPERHRQIEMGMVMTGDGWQLDAALFHTWIADYILRDRAHLPADNATIYRNVVVKMLGGELTLRRQWSSGWSAEVGAGYVRAENRSDDRPVAQMPPLEGVASLTHEGEQWLAGLRWRGAARQTRVDSDPLTGSGLDAGKTAAWGVLDIFAQWSPGERWRLDVGVDNLLDKRYAQHLNRASAFDPQQIQVNEPGRSAWVKLQADL